MIDSRPNQTSRGRPSSPHAGGKPGRYRQTRTKNPDPARPGRPPGIPLTRGERYWIQSKIERIPSGSRTEQEVALLRKVELS